MDAEKLEQLLTQNLPLETDALSNLSKQEQEILLLMAELKSIPVLNPPKAALRRKYALQAVKQPILKTFIFSFRLALTAAIVAMVSATGGLAYSAVKSLPGEKLFAIKKTAEQLRVKFATSDIQKAYLQVQIAKKRVEEAEKIVAQKENKDPKLELAALKELSFATELAAKQVGTLPPKTIKESPNALLASLEDVSQKEKNLVSSLTPAEDGNGGAEDVIALSLKNQSKVSAIKQSVEIAVAEEAVASLSSAPDTTVVVSGQITQIAKNKLTVEKTVFVLNEQSAIADSSGHKLKPGELKLENKVAASGKKVENVLVALKITVLETAETSKPTQSSNEPEGEVKGENAVKPKPNSTTPASILKPAANEPKQEEESQINPNTATGSFIMEDPKPQFAP